MCTIIADSSAFCRECGDDMNPHRWNLGYTTCLECGEKVARKKKHCIVPMHKSNYTVITDKRDLFRINNKSG